MEVSLHIHTPIALAKKHFVYIQRNFENVIMTFVFNCL